MIGLQATRLQLEAKEEGQEVLTWWLKSVMSV